MARPKNKKEYRQMMADTFVKVLEEKGLQWTKEWNGVGGNAPQSGISGKCYKGCNAFWLSLVAMVNKYDDPRWVTMVQIIDKKGTYHKGQKWHLKKGSKAEYVEYWYPYDIKKHRAMTWTEYSDTIKSGAANPADFTLLTNYTAVFNASQVEGMPELKKPAKNDNIQMDALVARLSENMEVQILNDGGDRAFYRRSEDKIHLPTPESFTSDYAYNATALHELAHSTGHEKRLNRKQDNQFGDGDYAYEELVAEMASCFMGFDLTSEADHRHIENHKAYVQAWVLAIKDKPDILTKAVKDAQMAANFMDWKAGFMTAEEFEALHHKEYGAAA